jgi:predicted metalloendopeptidase
VACCASWRRTGEKVKPSGVPIVGRFYGEVDADRVTESRYYDRSRKLDTVQNSLRAARSAGDGDAMVKMMDEHPEAALIQAQDKVQQRLSKLNKLAATTVDDRDMMKTIDEARLAEMRGLNEAFEEMEAAQGLTPGQRLKKVLRPGAAP